MFKDLLPFMIIMQTMQKIQAITQIPWPKASTDLTKPDAYFTVDCFTELSLDHMNKPLFINSSSFIPRKPCLIRIPTHIELIFSLSAVNRRSVLRIIAGNTRTVQHLATPQLQLHKRANSDVTNPVFVGCNYATIIFKPQDPEDRLFFLMKTARSEFIEHEDSSKCDNPVTTTTSLPSETRSKRAVFSRLATFRKSLTN